MIASSPLLAYLVHVADTCCCIFLLRLATLTNRLLPSAKRRMCKWHHNSLSWMTRSRIGCARPGRTSKVRLLQHRPWDPEIRRERRIDDTCWLLLSADRNGYILNLWTSCALPNKTKHRKKIIQSTRKQWVFCTFRRYQCLLIFIRLPNTKKNRSFTQQWHRTSW